MIRKLNALVLTLLSVLAINAEVASATLGHDLSTSSGGSVDITTTSFSNTVFGVKTGSLEVRCIENLSASNVANGAETVTLTPTYSGCSAKPFSELGTVDTNGCTYVLHGETTVSPATTGGSSKTDVSMDIVCPKEKVIEITTSACTISIKAQAGLHGIGFSNEGFGTTADVKLITTVDNIHYTTPGGFICSLGGLSTTGNDGFLTGTATARGYTVGMHGTHVGISK